MPSLASSNGTTSDYFKAFALAVSTFLHDKSENRNAKDIESLILVFSKLTDLSHFESRPAFLLDLKHLLVESIRSPAKNQKLLSSVSQLLIKLCRESEFIRISLRDKIQILPHLVELLAVNDVLNLIRYLTLGIRLDRIDSRLGQLIPKLLEILESKASELETLETKLEALFTLVSISRGNYVAAKAILSHLNEDRRKLLLTQKCDDSRLRILLAYLNFNLARINLSSAHGMYKLETTLANVATAFCQAFESGDCILMDLFTLFVDDLRDSQRSEEGIDANALLSILQTTLLASDFTSELPNESAFAFLRSILKVQKQPSLPILDILSKSLQLRLDTSGAAVQALQAILLVQDIFLSIFESQSTLDSTQLQSFRLLFDPILSVFCSAIAKQTTANVAKLSRKTQTALVKICDTLTLACHIDNWVDGVVTSLKSSVMSSAISDIGHDELGISLWLLMREVGKQSQNSSWLAELRALEGRRKKADLTDRLRSGRCGQEEGSKIVALLTDSSDQDELIRLLCPPSLPQSTPDIADAAPSLTSDDSTRVNLLMELLTLSVEKNAPQTNVLDVLELGEARLSCQRREMATLKSSLALADKRIMEQNELALAKELEIQTLTKTLLQSCARSEAAEAELEDIRSQHQEVQRKVIKIKTTMTERLEEESAKVAELEKTASKAMERCQKYKEQSDSLQETIAEHIKAQEELQAKLKAEVKANAELNSALEKKEDKLKRREKAFDDELAKRDKMEAELEALRKEAVNLQSLTKSQQQALIKKDKMLQEQSQELEQVRKIQEQIFNLSKRT